MPDYNSVFLQKTGQLDVISPWDDTKINDFLDSAAYIISRNNATPWTDFASVPEKDKYAVTIFAAIEYWWSKASEYATKYDMQVGGNISQTSSLVFDRAMNIIKSLKDELEEVGKDLIESSGDIMVGDMLVRSKFSGKLIPAKDDNYGDWTS